MRRRHAALLVSAVCGVAIASNAGAIANRAVFPGAASSLPATDEASRLWPGASRIDYASADGSPLAAAFLPARGEPRGSVVYFHATNGAAADAFWLARDLAARGLDVCVPEHRGYGGLPGRPTVAAIVDDGRAALAACPARGPGRRVLVGRSLGASVAAALARDGGAGAVVLISPFTSLDDAAFPFAWALSPDDRIDVAAAVRALEVPVTVLHGTRDALLPARMGAAVAAAAPRGRFVALEGRGHNDLALGDARARLLEEIAAASAGTRPAALSAAATGP